MKYKERPSLRYIAQTDVNKVWFNTVFAYAQTEAKTQTFWWARWRRCRWKNAASTWAV